MNNIVSTVHDDKHLSVSEFIRVTNQLVADYIAQPKFVGNAVIGLIKRATQNDRGAQLVIKRGDDIRQTALISHAKRGLMLVDYSDINLTSNRLIGLSAIDNVRPCVHDVVYSWPFLDINDHMALCDCIEELNRFVVGE